MICICWYQKSCYSFNAVCWSETVQCEYSLCNGELMGHFLPNSSVDERVCIAGWRPKKVSSQATHKWIISNFEPKKAGGRDMGIRDKGKCCMHSPSVQAVTPGAVLGVRVPAGQIFGANQSIHSQVLLEALQWPDHQNYKNHVSISGRKGHFLICPNVSPSCSL